MAKVEFATTNNACPGPGVCVCALHCCGVGVLESCVHMWMNGCICWGYYRGEGSASALLRLLRDQARTSLPLILFQTLAV